ncbi:unnamed protein product (mitochondrion) [Plasmodiophora brassicae]|uniref:Bms1-type G domain-containing protein n=1 Tax=Plasmodiophora brassicae TaxID=37360 RepID=A0A3P3YM88_PLABS|nr:unnamed protein product [Plasmodiophora brassicae]
MGTDSQHHHRKEFDGPKPFKGKSKGKAKRSVKGRIDHTVGSVNALSSVPRAQRLNTLRQLRQQKTAIAKERQRLGHGNEEPPKIVGFIPCHFEADARAARNLMLTACRSSPDLLIRDGPISLQMTAPGAKKSVRVTFVDAQPQSTCSALDVAKVADVLVLVTTPRYSQADTNEMFGVDEHGESIIRMIKAQGMPALVVLHQGLVASVPAKHVPLVRRTSQRYLQTLIAVKPIRILSADLPEECGDMIRAIDNARLRDIIWRQSRPYILVDNVTVSATGEVDVCGFIRGMDCPWSPNALVHVTGFGDFQVDCIEVATKNGSDMCDDETMFNADPSRRASLVGLAELDPLAREQSLITEEEMQEGDEVAALAERQEQLMRRGLSETQAAWESIMSGSDNDEDEHEAVDMADEGADHMSLAQKFRMERDELEFPDEVDVPLDQSARDRFQKYRGLKQFVGSSWDPMENLPLEYGHIVRFQSFEATQRRVMLEACEAAGPVPGSYVRIRIAGAGELAASMASASPLIVSMLYQHERQVSVTHYKVRRTTGYDKPVKSKEPVVLSVGFRRFPARPVYSDDSPSADKHRIERFLHANRYAIASAPKARLIATGTTFGCDPNRLNIKRIVLTGYPIRIHKRRAVVRYMFFRPDDIRWFKPVPLTTKGGLVGQIDEPLGTHGYFKCSFNGFPKYNDTIGMNLYKRQFPPWSEELFQGRL